MGDVEEVMQVLEAVDARSYVLQVVADHTALARKALEDTGLPESALRGLRELAEYALGRER